MLPNLIIIGAGKCGTTSLHRYLDLHPEISMSAIKELHFFVERGNWDRGLAWYEAQFPKATTIRGETSPTYTLYPENDGVPERMRTVIPEAKLIYLVRDPIERILSQYRFRRFSLHMRMPELNEVLHDYTKALPVMQSRYAYQLDRYLPHFPRSRMLVVDNADLAHDREATLRRVFHHLDVDADFTTPKFDVQHNESADLHANRVGRAALRTLHRSLGRHRADIVRAHVPRRLIRPLLGRQAMGETSVDPVLLAEVRAYLREDVERLRALTGQRFETWSV